MNKIKFYRKKEKLRQKDVADLLGLTPRAIGNYEQGIREPNLEVAKKLADLFDTTIEDLFQLK